jgi:DNA-binding NarL/FixJ family response regulator
LTGIIRPLFDASYRLADNSLPMPPVKTFIVEDSRIILDNLVAALEELSPVQVVGTAADEDGAMGWLKHDGVEVDLVIIDIFLQSGSGLGVLQRAAKTGVPGRRVVLTNYATAEMRKKCMELGADRVFDKSNELDELIQYCARLGDGGGDTKPGALT